MHIKLLSCVVLCFIPHKSDNSSNDQFLKYLYGFIKLCFKT